MRVFVFSTVYFPCLCLSVWLCGCVCGGGGAIVVSCTLAMYVILTCTCDRNYRNIQDEVASAFDMKLAENTKAPADVNASEYAAIVYAGGHGTMWDFNDAALGALGTSIYNNGGVVAAVCVPFLTLYVHVTRISTPH
jgi:putative intracellular protease/amidase